MTTIIDATSLVRLTTVRASPAGFAEIFRTRVFTPDVTSVTGPSFVDGRLYLRNLREVAAFALER